MSNGDGGIDIGAALEGLGPDPFGVGTITPDFSWRIPAADTALAAEVPSGATPTPTPWYAPSNLSALAKGALPVIQGAVGLGGTALGIESIVQAGRMTGTAQKAATQAQKAAAPAVTAAQELIPAGTAALEGGPLPPDLQAEVDSFRSQLEQRINQMAESLGIPVSTANAQWQSWIEQQVGEYRAQLAQGLVTTGTGAVQAATGAESAVGSTATAQAGSLTNAVTAANQALARLLSSQSS